MMRDFYFYLVMQHLKWELTDTEFEKVTLLLSPIILEKIGNISSYTILY